MIIFICIVLVFGVGLTDVEGNTVSPVGSIIEVANQNGFDVFIELLTETNLTNRLEGEDKYIIFAPTNEAFEKLKAAELSLLKSDPVSLERVLLSHISHQEASPDTIINGTILKSLTPGEELEISFTNTERFVNGKKFNENGIHASNGVLYPTSEVIYSSENDTNHGIEGETSKSESSIKILRDDECKSLAVLMIGAILTDLLGESDSCTVSAPKDETFSSLDSGELHGIKSSGSLLKSLIKSHVVEGEFLSNNLTEALIVESSLSGKDLKLLVKPFGSIPVSDIPIILRDLIASNGSVQVLNNILISVRKGLRSENSPTVLETTEDSITNAEHEIGTVVEVNDVAVTEFAKTNTSFYDAVNENSDLLPETNDKTSEMNGVGVRPSTQEPSESTVNTLETIKNETEYGDKTNKETDSSTQSDSVSKINSLDLSESPEDKEVASDQ